MFDALDKALGKSFNKDIILPSNLEMIYFTFFEKGISYNEFNELPIPYILGILRTKTYLIKLEEKEMKRKSNGK